MEAEPATTHKRASRGDRKITLTLPDEAPTKAREAPTKAPIASDEEYAQIKQFLWGIKDLSGLKPAELKTLLYEKRFEFLLPASTGDRGGAAGDGGGREQNLPRFATLPSEKILHDVLSSGAIPGAHQSVAHVLYPDAVSWPEDEPDSEGAAMDEKGFDFSRSARQRGSIRASMSQARRSMNAMDQLTPEEQAERDLQDAMDTAVIHAQDQVDDRQADFILCGQRMQRTVRGRAVKDGPVSNQVERSSAEPSVEAKFHAARDRRKQVERQAKLEQFHEQRIAERIKALELTKEAELEHRNELERKVQRRLARQEELKKDLEVGWQKKLEEERLQAEKQQQEKKAKAQEEQRKKRHLEKQRERVEQWHDEMDRIEPDPFERARLKRQEKDEKANQAARQLMEPPERLPMKRREVVNRIHMVQECTEERPPLAPKAHDAPRPVLQMLDDAAGKVSGTVSQRTTARTTASKAGSWVGQSKAVSRTYGLSSNDVTAIEEQLGRTARGLGRLARYEDSQKGFASSRASPRDTA